MTESAENSYVITQQDSVQTLTTEKPPPSPRLYQGVQISKENLKEVLKHEFTKYGIADQIPVAEKVIQCESGFQINPKPNGISWGVAQFTPATWKDFGHGEIMNPISQIEVMAKMWKNGFQNRWDCFTGRR